MLPSHKKVYSHNFTHIKTYFSLSLSLSLSSYPFYIIVQIACISLILYHHPTPIHLSQQAFYIAFNIRTDLMYVDVCWSIKH